MLSLFAFSRMFPLLTKVFIWAVVLGAGFFFLVGVVFQTGCDDPAARHQALVPPPPLPSKEAMRAGVQKHTRHTTAALHRLSGVFGAQPKPSPLRTVQQ